MTDDFEGDEQPLKEEDIDDWETSEPGVQAQKVSVLSVRFTGAEMRSLRNEAKRAA